MGPTTEFCALCALKHLSKAKIRLAESKLGYPSEYWCALGELSLAEDHLVAEAPAFAAAIRTHRKALESDPNYIVPFNTLLLTISRDLGYDVSGVLTRRGFMSSIRKFLGRIGFASVLFVLASAFTISQPSTTTTGASGTSSNEVVSIISTSTVPVALLAASLGVPGGDTTLSTEPGGVLVFTVVTNSTSLRVVSTSSEDPELYNGPAAGVIFGPAEHVGDPEGGAWRSDSGTEWRLSWWSDPESPFETYGQASVINLPSGQDAWYVDPFVPPGVFLAKGSPGASLGSMTLDWVPLTNVYRFSSSGLTTNRIIVAGDTLHFTNGCLKAITEAP